MTIEAYKLYNVNGATLQSGAVNLSSVEIPVAQLNAGVYLLQVKTTESIVVKKFVRK